MKARRIVALAVAVVLAAMPTVVAAGTGQQEGGVRFGPYTLEAGETWFGDLVVVGGPLTVEEDATVDGDAVVVGGGANVAGTIDRDLVVVGGRVELDDTAVVGSDVILVFSSLERSPRSRIGGTVEDPMGEVDFEGFEFDRFDFGRFDFDRFDFGRFEFGRGFPFSFDFPFERGPEGVLAGSFFGLVRTLTLVVTAIAIGLVLVAIVPDHLARVANSMRDAPWPTLGAGLGTFFGSLLAIVVFALTICGIPLAVLWALALAVAGVVGWVSLGYLVGQRLMEEGGAKTAGSLPAVVAGVLLITLITAAPFGLGSLFSVVAGSWGVGAVLLTRFGTRIYPEAAD